MNRRESIAEAATARGAAIAQLEQPDDVTTAARDAAVLAFQRTALGESRSIVNQLDGLLVTLRAAGRYDLARHARGAQADLTRILDALTRELA